MITSNSFLGLKDLSTTETGTLATGNTDSISLAPPQGKIYQIIHIGFYCAKVGTGDGGTHSWKLTNDSGVGGRNRLLEGTADYDVNMEISATARFVNATTSMYPDDQRDWITILNGLCFSSYDTPLYVHYTNSATTLDQTNNRIFDIIAKVYRECP